MSARTDSVATPPSPPAVGRPGPHSTASHALRWALADALHRLVRHESGVRSGNDPEDVHQARVATRRFRVILRQFRDLYAPQWADSLRADVKGLSDRLGAVRDADVLLARLQERVVALPMEDRPHGQTLVDNLARSRAAHGERLIALMCSPRYEQLLEAMHGAVREPQLTDPCELGAAEVLLPFARRTWRRLRGAVEDLGPQPGDRELHRVRIAGKRARYAANVLGPVVGKPAERFAGSAAELQDRLGDHQDAVVAQAWLRRTASDATQAEALVAGELVAAERSAAAEARATWPRAWEKLDRSRNTGWMGP